ncbi:MAG: hypothetical protein IAE98_03805 [Candidatus Kapabacteria bacterium]|nr:hypothetical protein [Candidatus Kapabacteria bacterium]
MFCYIIDKKIITFEEELDSNLYNYQKLSTEETNFYLQNPTASISEIINQELTVQVIDLNEYKENCIAKVSEMSFELRRRIYDDYKLMNVPLGFYSESEKNDIASVCSKFRNEFYRLKAAIQAAKTIEEVNEIVATNKYSEIN